MGTDMHGTIEIKCNGKWIFLCNIEPKRRYAMFARLADIRNAPRENQYRITPYKRLTGIPEDVSERTDRIINEWGRDGHSHTTYDYEELKEIFTQTIRTETGELITWKETGEEYKITPEMIFGKENMIWCTNKECMGIMQTYEECRMIIWFDN